MINLSVLRKAGFFKEFASLSDEDLLNKIHERRKQETSKIFGYEYAPEELADDQLIAWQDRCKMLHMDLEADVSAENCSYTRLLEDCNEVSGRQKLITDIREHWESPTGPIQVSYKINGHEKTYEPVYADDWIDQDFLDLILAEIVVVTGEPFHLCLGPNQEWFGQDVNYIRLTIEERNILEDELEWEFFDDFLKEHDRH